MIVRIDLESYMGTRLKYVAMSIISGCEEVQHWFSI